VSRYTKAAPGGRFIPLNDKGYHLCARCGEIQCTGDRVVAVYRTPRWVIYTHPPGPECPAKAVSGWRAVELALDMRESNIPTPRQAYPVSVGGFCLPFVSLLDKEHIKVELEVVTISPPTGEELRSDRITVRTTDGRQADPEDHHSYREHEYNVRQAGNKYDYVENSYIRALDEGRLSEHAKRSHETVYQERTRSYVKPGHRSHRPAKANSESSWRPKWNACLAFTRCGHS
jgi:hypothetical protein